jgi:hypothetical protein
MLSAMNATASERDMVPLMPRSAAEISTAPRSRGSCAAVSAVAQPPMLCPPITIRVVSIASVRAFSGSRRYASTAAASS